MKIIITGASGQYGQSAVEKLAQVPRVTLSSSAENPKSWRIGPNAGRMCAMAISIIPKAFRPPFLRDAHYADAMVVAMGPNVVRSGQWLSSTADARETLVWREECVACAVAVLTG